jgi:hypothetical protein
MRIFISHIVEEAALARLIDKFIDRDFLGKIEVFVSSDTESISAGENWLTSIDQALREASIELVLCSRSSVNRPWINFEAGAGWMRQILVIPVCHSGLVPRGLPMPLAVLQAISASDPDGLERMYAAIAKVHGSRAPSVDFKPLADEIARFEAGYLKKRPKSFTEDEELKKLTLARLFKALNDPAHRFRSLERLSYVAGMSKGETLDLIQGEPDIVLSKGKSGKFIARLKSR